MAATLADHARRLNRGAPPDLPALWLMTDRRLPDPVSAARALPRGAAVVLRHAGFPERETLGQALSRVCRERGLRLLVAVAPSGDWRLAVRLNAAGLHLPEAVAVRGMPPAARLWARGRLLSAAAHGPGAARRAAALGAVAVVSPAFATASHPGARTLGVLGVARLAAAGPAVALGGLTPATARRLAGVRNLRGLAAVSGLGTAKSGAELPSGSPLAFSTP